jgi:predicted cupin superfamily sugar epimerase
MQPHPEGGHYVEVYRSASLTSIFFLLRAGEISRWHRVLDSDEAWHFYEGDPIELLTAPEDFAGVDRHVLGPVAEGRRPVHVVPGGVWQAARSTGAYTLVGCSVGPGFDFANFEMLRDDEDMAARARGRHPDAAPFI